MFLILDNLPVHNQAPVGEWLDRHREKIEVFYLPSYRPELNPGELMNTDLKAVITKQALLRCKGDLTKALMRHLRQIAKSPERVKKCFEHAPVRYAA